MNITDLKSYYDILRNSELFVTHLEPGLALTMPVIEEELALGFTEAGLDAQQYALPSVIKQLCSQHNGFSLRWQYVREVDRGYPAMGFTNYVDAYAIIKQNVEHDSTRLFLFDDFLDMWKVYIALTADENHHKLHYFNLYEQRTYPMCIAAEAYIEKAALCRGMTNWHELFLDDRNYESDAGNRMRFRKAMTIIFPDTNFDEFIRI